MARVSVEGNDLVVRLSAWERLGAFRGDVRVRLADVRAVRPSSQLWSELRGIRAPGAGLPRMIALGTWRGRFGRDFAAVYRQRPGVVIELAGDGFQRLVISTDDAARIVAQLRARSA